MLTTAKTLKIIKMMWKIVDELSMILLLIKKRTVRDKHTKQLN